MGFCCPFLLFASISSWLYHGVSGNTRLGSVTSCLREIIFFIIPWQWRIATCRRSQTASRRTKVSALFITSFPSGEKPYFSIDHTVYVHVRWQKRSDCSYLWWQTFLSPSESLCQSKLFCCLGWGTWPEGLGPNLFSSSNYCNPLCSSIFKGAVPIRVGLCIRIF